jgi:arginase family enzyme
MHPRDQRRRLRLVRPDEPWSAHVPESLPELTEDARSVAVPFHLDDHEPELEMVVPAGDIVYGDLPAGSVWERLSVLHQLVAVAVAAELRNGDVPVVQSGCCTTALGTVAGMQRVGANPSVHVPGIRFPTPGGPTPEQLGSALRAVQTGCEILAIGLACTWLSDIYPQEPVCRVGYGAYRRAGGL